MSRKERSRLEVMARVREGHLRLWDAAALLGVSYRQAKRIKGRYLRGSDAGLVHGLRGRPSNRRTDASVRSAVLDLYRLKYGGFGPTLACEYLAKEDGRRVTHDTLGRWLRQEGLPAPTRKRGRHRARRPRREHAGELVQMDGSWHDWFEGRGGAAWCCLMVLVDDATGRAYCRFYGKETLAAAFDAFGRYARAYGLPRALYVDRAGIYRPDPDSGGPTQFGRAMGQLGVELILANSPQAKGRVERKNGTLQDRLVKEMRLRGIRDIDSANALLEASPFLAELNGRFRVKPAARADLHRRAAAGLKLDEVLCVCEERAVGRDWCVQWRGRLLQIDEAHERLELPRPGRRVSVIEKADRTVLVRYRDQDLVWREVALRPERPRPKPPRKPVVNNRRHVPPERHPWKARPACGPAATASSATPPQPLRPGENKGTVLTR
jgi:transposase